MTETLRDGDASDWPPMRDRIQQARAAKDLPRALELSRQAVRLFPGAAAAKSLLAQVLIADGRVDAARETIAELRDASFPDIRLKLLQFDLAVREARDAEIIEHGLPLYAQIEGFGAFRSYALLTALMQCERWDEAETQAQWAIEAFGPKRWFVYARFAAALARSPEDDWHDLIDDMVFGPAQRPEMLTGLEMLLEECGAEDPRLVAMCERALDTWPDHPLARGLADRTGLRPRGSNQCTYVKGDRKAQLAYAEHLLACENVFTSGFLQNAAGGLARDIRPQDLKRDLVLDNPLSEVLVSDPMQTGKAAIVFPGLNDKTLLPNELFDAYLAADGRRSVFVKDFQRLLGCNGIASLGADLERTAQALRDILETHGPIDDLLLIGWSGGGIAAANLARHVRADRLLLLAPPASIDKDGMRAARDLRAHVLTHRMWRQVAPEKLRLAKVLSHPDTPPTDLVFAQRDKYDSVHATALTGLENVRSWSAAGKSNHGVLADMVGQQVIPLLLQGRMEEFPDGYWAD